MKIEVFARRYEDDQPFCWTFHPRKTGAGFNPYNYAVERALGESWYFVSIPKSGHCHLWGTMASPTGKSWMQVDIRVICEEGEE